MLRPCIDGLICKLAIYILINFKNSYLRAQWYHFDDIYIKIIKIATGFVFKGNINTSTATENVNF